MVENDNLVNEQIAVVAEEMFTENGFNETSVREITEKVGCNVAAINYYYRGKDRLYIEVFRRRVKIISTQQNVNFLNKQKTLESLIQSFFTLLLNPFSKKKPDNNLIKLIMRERYDSHLPKEVFDDEVIQPIKNLILYDLLKLYPNLSTAAAESCIYLIIALLGDYARNQELFRKDNKNAMPLAGANNTLDHMLRFSIGGISVIAREA